MHRDKFISPRLPPPSLPSVRIAPSPSRYVKCRDADINKLQELPSAAEGRSPGYVQGVPELQMKT